MEHSFRIDNILPDLRAAMNNQSCYFEGRKPAEIGGFLENKPILTPESPEEEEKKCAESPNQDMNCRKRSKHYLYHLIIFTINSHKYISLYKAITTNRPV